MVWPRDEENDKDWVKKSMEYREKAEDRLDDKEGHGWRV